MAKKAKSENWLKFLGTAGARFVMIKQLRASGGIWVNNRGTNVVIDPGPGSIVRCAASKPKLDPEDLDAIILTHRHLDHSGDVNVMIEGMTEGGFVRKGAVFCPFDALAEDSVILGYARLLPERVDIIKATSGYKVKDFVFRTSLRHAHPCETYGLKFDIADKKVALISDTEYIPGMENYYRADILIICVVFFQPKPGVQHLCLDDARRIIAAVKPQKAVLTHFGMSMLQHKPHLLCEKLSAETGVEVIAAYDGMTVKF